MLSCVYLNLTYIRIFSLFLEHIACSSIFLKFSSRKVYLMQALSDSNIIQRIAIQVRAFHENDTTGHDWWHIWRVWNLARHIAQSEGANMLQVELAALLHDMDDHKMAQSDGMNLPNARKVLHDCNVDNKLIEKVVEIIKQVSFKGAGVDTTPTSIEACVVQDADRLDAIGAIGIARAFAYGGSKQRELYNPNEAPNMHGTFTEYKTSKGNTLNHFYEKLLLLKDRLNTQSARELADGRHRYMQGFVEQFLGEWNLEDKP